MEELWERFMRRLVKTWHLLGCGAVEKEATETESSSFLVWAHGWMVVPRAEMGIRRRSRFRKEILTSITPRLLRTILIPGEESRLQRLR